MALLGFKYRVVLNREPKTSWGTDLSCVWLHVQVDCIQILKQLQFWSIYFRKTISNWRLGDCKYWVCSKGYMVFCKHRLYFFFQLQSYSPLDINIFVVPQGLEGNENVRNFLKRQEATGINIIKHLWTMKSSEIKCTLKNQVLSESQTYFGTYSIIEMIRTTRSNGI